jgi:hypothetical protein
MNDSIAQAYSGSQHGGELPYFVGKQHGTGWLRTLARFAFPILKKAVGVATNTAEDVLVQNKPFVKSLKRNAIGELSNVFTNPPTSMNRRKRKQNGKLTETGTIFAKKKRRK